jgi:hypothetical protein
MPAKQASRNNPQQIASCEALSPTLKLGQNNFKQLQTTHPTLKLSKQHTQR